jgi:parallel beta-helix repeat protein
MILFAAVWFFVGCDSAPTGDEPPPDRDDILEALAVSASDFDGMDLDALMAPFDATTIAEAVRMSEREEAGVSTSKRSVTVQPGESIQAAIDAAPAGSMVFVRPGTYVIEETITINKSLHLVGLGGPNAVVIEEAPNLDERLRNGIDARGVEGLSLINLTVRGFEGNGVFFVGVDGFLLFRLTTDQLRDGAYGLFPVRSRNGIIAHCTATGADDAGIYVGQSENVAVVHNETYGNVIGLEAENVKANVWAQNRSYDNAAGMLAILLPPSRYIEVLHAEQLTVAHNRLTDNNGENFAPEGELASFVPSGTGLLVIGYDDSTIRRNRVTGNAFVGIGLGSTLTMLNIAGRLPDDPADLGIEPFPDDVRITDNRATGNGFGDPLVVSEEIIIPPVDLLWDRPLYPSYGTGNCWADNTFARSFPEVLPSCDAST